MASTVAMPQYINYPTTPLPGTLPPTVPVNNSYSFPLPPNNSSPPYQNVPIQSLQLPAVPVGGGCYNDGMEVVWHGEFSRLFSNFYPPHVWYLTITNQAPQHKWKFHRDSAKVRFCCQDCGNGWTSMKGRVTFWFYLNYLTNEGFVQFKLYGQQCKKCNSGKFEYVMWYPEEVSKVMCNVYNKVGQTYYGFMQPPIRIDRRPGRPRNQHNSDLCQACRDGECDQARPIKTMFNGSIHHTPLAIPAPPITNDDFTTPTSQPVVIPSPTSSESKPVVAPVINTQTSSAPEESSKTTTSLTVTPLSSKSPPTIISNEGGATHSPVALSGGMQPVLTYSVMTAPPQSFSLSATTNHFVPHTPPNMPPLVNYIYHPNPMLNGSMQMYPPPALPTLPLKSFPPLPLSPKVAVDVIKEKVPLKIEAPKVRMTKPITYASITNLKPTEVSPSPVKTGPEIVKVEAKNTNEVAA